MFGYELRRHKHKRVLAGTIQLLRVCNEQIAPIWVSERGIYAASTSNHPVTSKKFHRYRIWHSEAA